MREIYKYQSPYNFIQVWEDEGKVGRVMTLDGIIQLTSYDWHRYYEALCIIPYLFTKFARKVTILGCLGGYGAELLTSVFKTPRINIVEQDADLIETVRTFFYMPENTNITITASSPLNWVMGKGEEDIQTEEIVLADIMSPPSPHLVGLYSKEVLEKIKEKLDDDTGVFCIRGVGPYYNPKAAGCLVRTLGEVFKGWGVFPYSIHLPFYVPNQAGFYLVAKLPMQIQLPQGLRYLNPASVQKLFMLGNDEMYDMEGVEVSTTANMLYGVLCKDMYGHHVEEWEIREDG